jgi:hypothetical protein
MWWVRPPPRGVLDDNDDEEGGRSTSVAPLAYQTPWPANNIDQFLRQWRGGRFTSHRGARCSTPTCAPSSRRRRRVQVLPTSLAPAPLSWLSSPVAPVGTPTQRAMRGWTALVANAMLRWLSPSCIGVHHGLCGDRGPHSLSGACLSSHL